MNTYFVTNGVVTETYDSTDSYKAVLEFRSKHGNAIEDILIRPFGGQFISAVKVWPKARTSNTHKSEVV